MCWPILCNVNWTTENCSYSYLSTTPMRHMGIGGMTPVIPNFGTMGVWWVSYIFSPYFPQTSKYFQKNRNIDGLQSWSVNRKTHLEGVIPLCGKIIYLCKSTMYFCRHNNIMIYLLNFNTIYIIILATCFDSYESSSGINFKNY